MSGSSAENSPRSVYRAAVVAVVVPGSDVHVAAHAVVLAPNHESDLGVRLESRQAVGHMHAEVFQRARPRDVVALRRSVPAAQRGLRPAFRAAPPRSGRRTIAVSPDVRYSVSLIAITVGRLRCLSRKRSTERLERLVGVMHEDVALRMRSKIDFSGRAASGDDRRERGTCSSGRWRFPRSHEVARSRASGLPPVQSRAPTARRPTSVERRGARRTSSDRGWPGHRLLDLDPNDRAVSDVD